MDLDKAIAQLKKMGAAGKQAGDDVKSGTNKGKSGLEDVEGAAARASQALLGLNQAQMALSMIKQAGAAVAQQFKETADYVKKLADDFAVLRRVMQELAALSDKPITDKFVLEQAAIAHKFGLTIEENRVAQGAFKNVAGAMVGDVLDKAG